MVESKSTIILFSNDLMSRNGDQYFPYRQDSDFYYLTGIEQVNSTLVICPDHTETALREVLFIDKPDPDKEKWNGSLLIREQAKDISGIENVFYLEDFEGLIPQFLMQSVNIYLNSNEYPKYNSQVQSKNHRNALILMQKYPLFSFKRLQPLLISMRLIKKPEELGQIKMACSITNRSFKQALKVLQPGIKEYEIEAEILAEFIRQASDSPAYAPIIASGRNALILHYIKNAAVCLDGDLVLMDFGAEYGNYASDCSRTVPVNGRFSPRQRQVYSSVLKVFKEAKKLYIPGNSIQAINQQVAEWLQDEMVQLQLLTKHEIKQALPGKAYMKYYYHGAAHFMGLDVHDPGGKEIILQEGMVLTCEPGLYIPEENLGVRIENDILVHSNPIDLMEEIPVEIEEIENLICSLK
ncbi:MAG: aminopeptidase P N-terminal domain-containing protein [Bacteroidales bacterium]|nr:aminopeptidase P N-terminal domain-containing protein [Bacteroidales bacterium]